MASSNSKKASGNGAPFDVRAARIGAVYAKALLASAEQKKQSEAVLAELDSFIDDVLDKLPKLEAVLVSGVVSVDEKLAMLNRSLSGRTSSVFLNFLRVVAKHERLDCLRAIRGAAHEQYDEMRGRFSVKVVTAHPLDDGLSQRISERLRQILGGEPVLVRETDADLIGGIVVRVKDTVYDGSVATQLAQARSNMINRSVHEIQSRRDRFRYPE